MGYTLLDAQREFVEVPHKNKLDVAIYQGGYGSGKTWAGALLGILLCRKYPGCRGLVGAKEYELVRKTTLDMYFSHFEILGYRKGVHYFYNKIDKEITFKNGSRILFSGLEDSEKIKSLNLHWVEIEEVSQIRRDSFDQLLARLRAPLKKGWKNFRYRLFGHTNPQANKGWIYEAFIEKKQPNFRLIIAPTTQNKHLPKHFVESLKSVYDSEYYKINVLGEFGDYSSGLVVKGFSEENIKKISYVKELDLHLSCDFNVDPMCWCLAHKGEEKVYFFDEIVLENTNTQRSIEYFIEKYRGHRGKVIINGDASGDNRSCSSEFTNYVIMKKALIEAGFEVDIKIRSYNPPIKNRIAAFCSKVCSQNDKRGVLVDRRCEKLLYNIYNLSYKAGTSLVDIPSISTVKGSRQEKFLMHPFDAASYLVEYYWPIV